LPTDKDSNSETESEEDQGLDDTHKLAQIAHAATLGQPVTVRIRRQFDGEGQKHEVYFQKEFRGITGLANIFGPLQLAFKSLEILSRTYRTERIPGSCLWTLAGVPREEMEIQVSKLGRSACVTYGWANTKRLAIATFPTVYRIELLDGLAVVFGAAKGLTNLDLTQKMINISAP
jgi:hypothetical protein